MTQLSLQALSRVLASNEVRAAEILVFDALMRWVRAQPSLDEGVFGGLLKLIRFKCIPAVLLSDVVKQEPLLAGRDDAQRYLMEAYEHYALPPARREAVRRRGPLKWNPDDKHAFVKLSDDLLEVSYQDQGDGKAHQENLNGLVRATYGWSSGRHYWEFTVPEKRADGAGYPTIGVVSGDVPLGGSTEHAIGGEHHRGWGYYTYFLEKVHGGVVDDDGPALLEDDWTFGLLLDVEAGTLSLYLDGVLQEESTHTGVTGVGPLYAAIEAGTLSMRRFRVNFDAKMPGPPS